MRIVSLYYFMLYLAASVLLPYTSLHFHERGFSPSMIGYVLSLWAFVSVIAQPVMGILNDRINRPRAVLIVLAIAAPLFGLLFYIAKDITAIILVSIAFAWFQSSLSPLSDAVAVEIGRRQGFAFGNVRLWGALSYAIGAFLTGLLYEKLGYSYIFLVYALLALPVIVVMLFVPVTKATFQRVSLFQQMGDVVRNRRYLSFCALSFVFILCITASATFLPIYFDEKGFDKSYLGSAVAIAALIEVPMFWIAAKLSAKLGRYRLLTIAAALYALKYIILFATGNVYITLSLQLLDGIGFAFLAGVSVEIVDRLASSKTKATFQMVYAAVTWGLGGIIGNSFGGLVVEHFGVASLYLFLCIPCLILAPLYAAMGMERRHKGDIVSNSM